MSVHRYCMQYLVNICINYFSKKISKIFDWKNKNNILKYHLNSIFSWVRIYNIWKSYRREINCVCSYLPIVRCDEYGCRFVTELTYRLIFCPSIYRFLKQLVIIGGIVDIIWFLTDSVILPTFWPSQVANLEFLQFLLLARLFSMFTVVEHYTPFKIMRHTFVPSAR
jgi:hypothetical protein